MEKEDSLARKAGSGRKSENMTSKRVRALKRYMKNHLGASQRKAALKFGVSLAYVNKIVCTKTRHVTSGGNGFPVLQISERKNRKKDTVA